MIFKYAVVEYYERILDNISKLFIASEIAYSRKKVSVKGIDRPGIAQTVYVCLAFKICLSMTVIC